MIDFLHLRKQMTGALVLLGLLLMSFSAQSEQMVLLSEDAESFQARADLILEAKNEILVEYFSIWDDEPSVQVLSLLSMAARNGVKVKVIVDSLASVIPASVLANLESNTRGPDGAKNLEIKQYNPFFLFTPFRINHRDHAKLLIADGKRLVIGGRNIGDSYFLDKKGEIKYRDLDLLLEGPVAQAARENFYAVWNGPTVKVSPNGNSLLSKLNDGFCAHGPGRDYDRCRQDVASVRKLLDFQNQRSQQAVTKLIDDHQEQLNFFGSPKNWFEAGESLDNVRFVSHDPQQFVSKRTNSMTQEIIKLLESAEGEGSTVTIVSPYLAPPPEILQTLSSLIQRKVRVQILTNSFLTHDHTISQAGYKVTRDDIIKLGIELWEYKGPDTLHAKLAVVENPSNTAAMVGTYNFNRRSANLDREVGVILRSDKISLTLNSIRHEIDNFRLNCLLVGRDGQEQNKEESQQLEAKISSGKKFFRDILRVFFWFYYDSI